MLFAWEIQDHVRHRTGIRLGITDWTAELGIASNMDRAYRCTLHGPFEDLDAGEPSDLRIFVVVRELDGNTYLQLLVQDADDDTFLNSNASGAEKYNVGIVGI